MSCMTINLFKHAESTASPTTISRVVRSRRRAFLNLRRSLGGSAPHFGQRPWSAAIVVPQSRQREACGPRVVRLGRRGAAVPAA